MPTCRIPMPLRKLTNDTTSSRPMRRRSPARSTASKRSIRHQRPYLATTQARSAASSSLRERRRRPVPRQPQHAAEAGDEVSIVPAVAGACRFIGGFNLVSLDPPLPRDLRALRISYGISSNPLGGLG